jgi:hypothetical protein
VGETTVCKDVTVCSLPLLPSLTCVTSQLYSSHQLSFTILSSPTAFLPFLSSPRTLPPTFVPPYSSPSYFCPLQHLSHPFQSSLTVLPPIKISSFTILLSTIALPLLSVFSNNFLSPFSSPTALPSPFCPVQHSFLTLSLIGLRPCNSFPGNSYFEFSVLCLFSQCTVQNSILFSLTVHILLRIETHFLLFFQP